MTTESNKALVRRLYDEAFNRGNLAAVDELISPDYTQHSVLGLPNGRDGLKQFLTQMGRAFPDGQLSVDDMLAEGDRVAARTTFRGTQRQAFADIPATGKAITLVSIDIFRIADGKLVEHWDVVDQLGMLRQLGLAPSAPPPA